MHFLLDYSKQCLQNIFSYSQLSHSVTNKNVLLFKLALTLLVKLQKGTYNNFQFLYFPAKISQKNIMREKKNPELLGRIIIFFYVIPTGFCLAN